MNVSEITDDELNSLLHMGHSVVIEALARAELSRRAAKVEYWYHGDQYVKTENRVIVENSNGRDIGENIISDCWTPITQQAYESAKPKPASVAEKRCENCRFDMIDDFNCTANAPCVRHSLWEPKDKPETRSCENCGNGPYAGDKCIEVEYCSNVPDSLCYHSKWIPKPKPAVGEGAIAIEPWVNPNEYSNNLDVCVKQLQRRVEAVENRLREGK